MLFVLQRPRRLTSTAKESREGPESVLRAA
jgi:hypothetical protein